MEIELSTGSELARVMYHYGLLGVDNEFKIVCPFHDDVNASMKVNLNNGSFYCFGCSVSGDALQFVMLVNKKMDPLHACIEYHKILKSKDVQAIHVKHHVKSIQDNVQALNEAYDFYYGLKTIKWENENGPEKDYMIGRGYTAKTLTKCKAKLTYGLSYPIVFPMNDMGEFRGWVCRTMDKKVEEKRKYLYNAGFCRTNTLVGDYGAKTIVLVEGFMDYLKMKQYGVKKVTAILGWKVTAQQVTKLKKQGVTTIISALDNDSAGHKGTEYLKQFFKVVPFRYPPGIKDPGELGQNLFNKANEKTKKDYRRTINHGTC